GSPPAPDCPLQSGAPTYLNSGGEEKLRFVEWLISAILVEINHLQRSLAGNVESPARCLPRHFAKFMHCQDLAGVTGMLLLDPCLESRYGVREIRGSVAVHFIGAHAIR